MTPMGAPRILVVDDEKGVRDLLSAMLSRKGYLLSVAGTAEAALKALDQGSVDLVITDLRLPGLSGEALVGRLQVDHPTLPVIVISAFGGTKDVVEVIKQGAVDYLSKPFLELDLDMAVAKALRQQGLLIENERLRREMGVEAGGGVMVGRSPAMRKLLTALRKVAVASAPVLLRGDSGTGKELAARAIHARSPRHQGPFVGVNAGAIPASLFEADLFGSRKGAYTGSEEDRPGLFRSADGGTLFLDEVGEIPLEMQAKLLRVLETGEVRAVGEVRPRKVDVRVVSATNRDLESMVARGTFRKDLYYRLSVLPLTLPPLAQRREDIPLLVDHLLAKVAPGRDLRLSPAALQTLMDQPWPGNVRELKNVLERAVLFTATGELQAADLVFSSGPRPLSATATPLRTAKRQAAEAFERQYLLDALRSQEGNISRAARYVGMDRRNFQALLRRHQLRASSDEA